ALKDFEVLQLALRADYARYHYLQSCESGQLVRCPRGRLLLYGVGRHKVLRGPGGPYDGILQRPGRGRIICSSGRVQINGESGFVVENTIVTHSPAAVSGRNNGEAIRSAEMTFFKRSTCIGDCDTSHGPFGSLNGNTGKRPSAGTSARSASRPVTR